MVGSYGGKPNGRKLVNLENGEMDESTDGRAGWPDTLTERYERFYEGVSQWEEARMNV